MSSILLESSTSSVLFENPNDSGGLDIVAQQEGDNFIVINDDSAGVGDDIIIGGSGLDFISASEGDDILISGDSHDIIEGGEGSDIIQARGGDDILIGGEGSDLLIGGEGADVFEFNAEDFANGEIDSILDFEEGVDRIRINGVDPDRVTADEASISLDGEIIINLNNNGESGATDDDTFELF